MKIKIKMIIKRRNISMDQGASMTTIMLMRIRIRKKRIKKTTHITSINTVTTTLYF